MEKTACNLSNLTSDGFIDLICKLNYKKVNWMYISDSCHHDCLAVTYYDR